MFRLMLVLYCVSYFTDDMLEGSVVKFLFSELPLCLFLSVLIHTQNLFQMASYHDTYSGFTVFLVVAVALMKFVSFQYYQVSI